MSSSCDTCPHFFATWDACPTVPWTDFEQKPVEYLVSMEMAITSTMPFMLFFLFTFYFLFTWRKKYLALLLGLAIAGGINELIFKPYFKQPRPPLACSTSYGMPSGHSVMSGVYLVWAIYCFAFRFNKCFHFTVALCIFAINNAYSRIYLHYHTVQQVEWGLIWGISFSV